MSKRLLISVTGGGEGVRHQQRPENSEFLRRGRWRPDPGPLELSEISQPGRPGSTGSPGLGHVVASLGSPGSL